VTYALYITIIILIPCPCLDAVWMFGPSDLPNVLTTKIQTKFESINPKSKRRDH